MSNTDRKQQAPGLGYLPAVKKRLRIAEQGGLVRIELGEVDLPESDREGGA